MRINEDLLCYMTIRVDGFEEGPSAMMRNRDRDDRPRRSDRGDRAPRYDEDDSGSKLDAADSSEGDL